LLLGACSKAPEEVETSAAQHLSRNESRSAMIELKDLLQREPDRPQSRLLLGQALNDQDDYAAAEGELRRAAALGVGADLTAPPLARAMFYQGRFEEILREPMLDAAKDPLARATVLERKAAALLALGRTAEAIPPLEQARELAPNYGPASATLASVMISEKRTGEATAVLEAALKAAPRSAEVHRSFGSLLLAMQQPAEAVAYFAKAADLAVGPPRDRQVQRTALAALVDTEMAQRRIAPAEAALLRLDGLGVGRINGLLRARLLMLKDDLTGARRELEALLAGGRSDPDASLLLGIVLFLQGSPGQAEMHLNEVLALAPGNYVARQVLAQLRLQAGKPKEALAVLEPVLKEASGNLVTLAVQANLAAGDRAAALGLLERGAAASVGNAAASADVARGYLLANEPGLALESLPPVGSSDIKDVAAIEGLRLAALLAKNDVQGATQLAADLAKRDNGNAVLQTLLADFYVRVGDTDAARAALTQAEKLKPNDVDVTLRLARLDALAGKPAQAEARLAAAIKAVPLSTALQAGLADLQAARGDPAAALRALQKAQELAPGNQLLLVREAQLRLAQRDIEGAGKAAETALKRAPDDKTVIRARIATLLAAKDNAAAVSVARDALQRRPDDPDLALLLSGVQVAAGDLEAASKSMQDAISRFPSFIPLLSAAADLQLRTGDVSGARRTGALIASVERNHPSISLIEAGAAIREKRFDVAAAALSSANAKLNQPALAIREFLLRREGGLPAPEAPLERWLESNRDVEPVLLALGEYRLSQGRTQDALKLYRRLLEGQPRNAIALNNAAWAMATLGDNQGAVALAQRALDAAPAEPAIADTLGWALSRSGEHARALEVLAKARKSTDPLPDVEYHYAMALVGLGRKDEAKAVLETLLTKNANFQSRAEALSLRDSLNN